MVNAANYRTAELVGPGSLREKFDRSLPTLLELPTIIALRRRELETRVGRRVRTIGKNCRFEAVISVNCGDFQLYLRSGFDMDPARREFVLLRRHLDDLHILCLRGCFRPLS